MELEDLLYTFNRDMQPNQHAMYLDIYCELINVDVKYKNDYDLPTDESIKRFTQSLSDSRTRLTILLLLMLSCIIHLKIARMFFSLLCPLHRRNPSMGLRSRS